MRERVLNNEFLQSMLDYRASYLAKFKSTSDTVEQKDDPYYPLMNLALPDTLPTDFQKIMAKLNSIIEISERAENEFVLLTNEKRIYEGSVAASESGRPRIEKYNAMVTRMNALTEMWGSSLTPLLPLPDLEPLKIGLETLLAQLEKIDPLAASFQEDFLDLYRNERELNRYLLNTTKEKIEFLRSFKEKPRKFEERMYLMRTFIQLVEKPVVIVHAVKRAEEKAPLNKSPSTPLLTHGFHKPASVEMQPLQPGANQGDCEISVSEVGSNTAVPVESCVSYVCRCCSIM